MTKNAHVLFIKLIKATGLRFTMIHTGERKKKNENISSRHTKVSQRGQ